MKLGSCRALLLLLAVLAGSWRPGSLQRVRFPRLMPPDREITLQPGETLRVRCEGYLPVTWNYTSLAQNIAERVTITDEPEQDNPDYPYVSHIEIRDVSFLDVGYQRCHYVGTTSLDARPNVTSVYLFVNDPNNLLVKTSPITFVTVTQHQQAVLPCRPTHPDVAVTLYKDGSQITDLASRSMIYKKKEGFIIFSPVLAYHNGAFQCHASWDGTRDKLEIYTHYIPSSDTVQQPRITSDDAQHAYLGGNFTLECRVHHQAGIFHVLSWSVPGSSTGLKTGRIVQLPQEVEQTGIPGGNQPDLASQDVRRLVVTDARFEDEGDYTCHVEDQNGHKNSRDEFVAIHDRTEATVRLQTDTTRFVTEAGKYVKIVVSIYASPMPEVIWYDPAGEEIMNQALKYSVTVRPDDTILQIFDLTLEDMGKYRVVASSTDGNATDSLTFDLTVQAAPKVSVGPNQVFYPAGERVMLHCTATGWPAPVVGWEFAPCATRDQCRTVEDFDDIKDTQRNGENESHSTSPQRKWRIKSTLTLVVKQSGVYRCHATNKFPTSADVDAPFFVSDVMNGFGILPTSQAVVVGDNLNLTCAGSRFAFDGVYSLTWLKDGNGQNGKVKDGDGIQVVSHQTMYSYQKTLMFTNIQADKSGRYLCSATNMNGNNNRTDRLIVVKASASPQFLSDSNMDSSARLTFEEGTRGELNCTVSGLPSPTVTWTKDGQKLELSESGRIHVSPDGQRLVISAAISDDAGDYQCVAENRVGALLGSASVDVPGGGANVGLIAGITGVMFIVLIGLSVCLVWKMKQQKNLQKRLTKTELEYFTHGRMAQFNPNMPIDEQAELLPYDSEWEFPKEKLILGRQIGSGAFGRVVKAEAIGLNAHEARTTVAVKMPKSGSDPNQIRSMMAELKIMIQLGKHLNVVNLLGAVTKHAVDGEFMVMVEYCRHGNLHQYLQRHKTCFIDQVDPITGEYDPNLGEEEYEAAMAGGLVNENTPLNLAGGGGGGGGIRDRSEHRLTVASCDSFYKTPRCNSTTSSLQSAGYNTDMTAADGAVCHSPGVTGGEDSMGIPRLNTGASVRPRRVPLTTRDLLRWSYQVARGMEYLASRKLLHGDLAARNILLAENNIVKISDFGLSRDIYKTRDYRKKGKGLLPVKWMAIESIQDSIFSTQSDVWAFGVVMWEFFSLGASPYPGMEYDLNFVRRLRDGYRMERPKFSPQAAYKLMLEAWAESPGDRPSFTELAEKLGHSLEDRIREEYILLNEPFKGLNEEYFARRTDYVAAIVSPDYQNVMHDGDTPADEVKTPSYVNVDPQRQTAAYRASQGETGGGGDGGTGEAVTGPDGYLMMTPSADAGPEKGHIFSPRPTAVVKPFDFPAGEAGNNFYNPSYDEAAKGLHKRASQTSQSSPAKAAPPEEDEDHYLSPRLEEDEDHYLSPRPTEDEDHYLTPRAFSGESAV